MISTVNHYFLCFPFPYNRRLNFSKAMPLVRKANNSKIVLVRISNLLKFTQLRFQQNTAFM